MASEQKQLEPELDILEFSESAAQPFVAMRSLCSSLGLQHPFCLRSFPQ
jgi:hypothetical protein